MAEALTSTVGGCFIAPMASTTLRVPSTRLDRIRSRAGAVHRWATGSPARCTTASQPSKLDGLTPPRVDTARTSPNRAETLRPTNPDAPVIAIILQHGMRGSWGEKMVLHAFSQPRQASLELSPEA